jgi:integrase
MEEEMTNRRANGEGSVYRRGNGRYVGKYEDANGKRRYLSGKTKADVSAKRRKAIDDREAGIVVYENLSVEKFMEHWLEAAKDSVKPNTWRPYEAITGLHLVPAIGKTKLDKLNALQLHTLYKGKLASGLSPRRVQYIHVTVKKASNVAMRWQLVNKNVAAFAKPPRPPKHEITPLSKDQMCKLLETVRGNKLDALYVLAVTTGMRQGEILGLQWRDIDCGAFRGSRLLAVTEPVANEPVGAFGTKQYRYQQHMLSLFA